MTRRRVGPLALAAGGVLWLIWPALARGEEALSPCGSDADAACFETAARQELDAGRSREAVALLKTGAARFPESSTLALWLAKAYLADGNDFWALRTLTARLDAHPAEDAALRPWLAWARLRQGFLAEARAELDEAPAPTQPADAARFALTRAMIARAAHEPETARGALDAAYNASLAYPEDRAALQRLKPELDPAHRPPLGGRLELWGGWTANARAGSPRDAAQSNEAPSAFGAFSANLRFAPNLGWGLGLRPALEAETRMTGYAAEEGRDASTILLSGRPGLMLAGAGWSALGAYRYEALLLAGGDRYDPGPLWFYAAHRGEAEISPLPWLTLFFGAGERAFREAGRDRMELDGGVGVGGRPLPELNLIGALSLRRYDARKNAYDLFGKTLLVSAEYFLPHGLSLRGGLTLSLDDYARSAGYFDPLRPAVKRWDRLVKPSIGFWSPAWEGLRGGVVYEYSRRFSTARPYAYTDHRLMAKLTWTFAADPWLPTAVQPAGHVPLDWGLAGAAGADGERIQDLLRQDEAIQRGSSCVE